MSSFRYSSLLACKLTSRVAVFPASVATVRTRGRKGNNRQLAPVRLPRQEVQTTADQIVVCLGKLVGN